MNAFTHLTKRSATRARAVCFIDRQEGGHLAIAELLERYEADAALPSVRRAQHRELLEECFPMFGMPCPVLPVTNFHALAETIATDLDFERLERVWVEVINRRGDSMVNSIGVLQGNHPEIANRLARVCSSEILWEVEYNRAAFLAFKEVIPPGNLSYLTYVTPASEPWWSQYVGEDAVLL